MNINKANEEDGDGELLNVDIFVVRNERGSHVNFDDD